MTDLVQGALGNWVPAALHPVIGTGLEMLFIFCLGLLLTWTIRVFFRRINGFVIRMDGRLESMTPDDARRINTLLDVVQTFVVLLLWGIVAVMMLGQAGVNIGPILAGAGIVGVALGFGAQHLVRDLISGFFIIMENHIRLGDVAVINGTSGMVERITYRVIVLRDMAGVVHVFPHGQINTLANMTKDYSYALMDIRVGYKEHPDRVMTVLKGEAAAMAAEAEWAKAGMTGAEVLGVDALDDSGVVIRLRIKTHPLQQWSVKREFLRRIKLAFDREGIEMPYPYRALVLGSQQGPLPVRVESAADSQNAPSDIARNLVKHRP